MIKDLCSKCNENPRIIFSSGKIDVYCRPCRNKFRREWYQRHREERLEYAKIKYKKSVESGQRYKYIINWANRKIQNGKSTTTTTTTNKTGK